MKRFVFSIYLAQALTASVVCAQTTWVPDIPKATQVFERELGKLRPQNRIEATAYRDFYALRSNDPMVAPAYFDVSFSNVCNLAGAKAWAALTPEAARPDAIKKLRAGFVKDIPTEKFLKIDRGSAPVFVVYSSPDCPYCKAMELALEKEAISYYVAPAGLSEKGFSDSKAAYCSNSPSKAWKALFHGIRPASSRENCDYPKDAIVDFGFFFATTKTGPGSPQIVFADGTYRFGWQESEMLPEIKKRLKAGIVFK